MPAKTQNQPMLKDGEYEVKKVMELAFFDLTGEKAKTKGSSNKSYHAELHVSKTKTDSQIYTMWGATGCHQTQDWRYYNSETDALKDFDAIIKSKKKKGYQEIDVAQRVLGSDEAKKITKAVELKNLDIAKDLPKSSLHTETQRLISSLMGATNQFVIKTLKCPLGQLTNKQIDEGRARLNEAKTIVAKSRLAKADEARIVALTNEFYSLIPHNFSSGARGQMLELLLDTQDKIIQKEYDLDTLLDAKDLNVELTGSGVDDQYKSLETEFSFIDHIDDRFKWLDKMIQETRASNHHYLGKISLLNAWSIQRKGESDKFRSVADKIAMECGKQVFPNKLEKLVKTRPDGNPDLYQKANVIPLFHGTRTENLTGILKKGLLIRPSGAVITGSMYDKMGAIYFGKSSKSINYTNIKASYWANGNDNIAYLFIADCVLGNQLIAKGPYGYTLQNIKPNHSVYAVGGASGVVNDEFMLYQINQHNIRYLLEFTCLKN
jgi:poly [ADP-ribose] polymerase